MPLRNTEARWGLIAIALHWVVAAGIFWLIWLGLEQADLPRGAEKLALRETHGSWALLVFVLMTLRLLWRLANVSPQLPESTPRWQAVASSLSHSALYIVVFVQLAGGAMTMATGGKALPFFGLFTIPLPVTENDEAHEFWEEIHEFMWKPLAALIVLHVLAALYNHFVRKNDVLRRMTVGARA